MGVNGIYGLSGSGLDIESMVKVGMMSKQNEYDKMAQKYTKNEWTKAAYLEINNTITTFNMSTLTQYKLSSNMNAKTTTSSNENAVTATANASAANMNHKVKVEALSTNAYLIGTRNAISEILKGNGVTTSSNKLKDILFANGTNNYTQNITTNYTTRTTESDGTVKYSGSGTFPTTSVTTDDSDPDNRTLTIKYTPTSGYATEYTATGGTKTTNTVTTLRTTYTNGTQSLTLKEITDTTTDNDGNQTSSSITYKIDLNDGNGEQEYTKTTNLGTVTYTRNDDPSKTVAIDSLGIISINGGSISYGSTISTGTSSVETETTTYSGGNAATMTKTTTTAENGTATIKTEINFTDTNAPQVTINETADSSGNVTFSNAKTVAKENFINNDQIVYDSTRSDVRRGLLATESRTVSDSDKAIAFKIGDGTNEVEISFTYGEINSGKTINDLVSKINSEASSAGVNVKASYDNNNELFSLYNSKGGEENKILITAVDTTTESGASTYAGTVAQKFFNALGLKQSTGDSLVAPKNSSLLKGSDDSDHLTITNLGEAEGVSGTNGKITVDGVEYDNITDNKVTVGGVTYNAHSTTSSAATVSIGQDVDAIVDKVKSFVESYNKILSELYEKYEEKGDSNYKPLTQSQKDAMKEDQIEKWEEKAKKGLLYHDSTLRKIIDTMRSAISQSVEGVNSKYNSAYSIGISTTGIKGQLVLDETKLKNALAADPDAAYNVFAKLNSSATTDNRTGVVKQNGIAQRLGDVFTTATKNIKSRAGSSADITEDSDLNNLLRELQTKMSNFKKLMSSFETKLYKKYDAMEAALAKLGTQLNFITGAQG